MEPCYRERLSPGCSRPLRPSNAFSQVAGGSTCPERVPYINGSNRPTPDVCGPRSANSRRPAAGRQLLMAGAAMSARVTAKPSLSVPKKAGRLPRHPRGDLRPARPLARRRPRQRRLRPGDDMREQGDWLAAAATSSRCPIHDRGAQDVVCGSTLSGPRPVDPARGHHDRGPVVPANGVRVLRTRTPFGRHMVTTSWPDSSWTAYCRRGAAPPGLVPSVQRNA